MGVLFLSMPLAWIGTKIEGWLREQERGNYNKLLNWARHPDDDALPTRLVAQSVLRTFLMSWLIFYGVIICFMFSLRTFFTIFPGFLTSISITWAHLWVAATLGGLMALRVKRVYGVLVTGVGIVFLYTVFASF